VKAALGSALQFLIEIFFGRRKRSARPQKDFSTARKDMHTCRKDFQPPQRVCTPAERIFDRHKGYARLHEEWKEARQDASLHFA